MTVTKEQASTEREFHYGTCVKTIGLRGGIKMQTEAWRANGMLKTWVTRPDEFRLPLSYGLYDHDYLTHVNAGEFHLASECEPRVIDNRKAS